MTAVITHTKVSGKAAGTDPNKVYGTHWDADHTITGAFANAQLDDMVQGTVKGRGPADGTGAPTDLATNPWAVSLTTNGGDANFALLGPRAFMDFAAGYGRMGSLAGGGAAPGLKLYSGGNHFLTAAANGGVTNQVWGTSSNLSVAPGDPASGPGGNAFDGGILTQAVTGNYQVGAYQIRPTSGTAPEWGPITELVMRRVDGTDYQRVSLTAMGAWAGPALNDAAIDYRIQMEAGGAAALLPLHITSQQNASGLVYFYFTAETGGNVRLFRRTDSPGVTADNLALILGQQKRATANVLTAAGQQDSPQIIWEGNSYDSALHTASVRAYVDVTSNAGAATWKLQYQLDSAGWGDLLTITSAGVANIGVTLNTTNMNATAIGGSTLRLGTAAAQTVGAVSTQALQVTGTGADARALIARYDAAAGGPSAVFAKSRGAVGTPGAVVAGDELAHFRFYGDDGTNLATLSSSIVAKVGSSGTIGTGVVPGRIEFATMPAAGGALVQGLGVQEGAALLTSYTVAGVPAATIPARIIYVSNEAGGAVLAFSDGTNWRRVTDRAVIS